MLGFVKKNKDIEKPRIYIDNEVKSSEEERK